jgi:YHS domain-containing protein
MRVQPGAVHNDWVRCPVSGAHLRIGPSSERLEFNGATYVVCCAGCAEAFRQDPLRYLTPTCK